MRPDASACEDNAFIILTMSECDFINDIWTQLFPILYELAYLGTQILMLT